MTKTIDGLTVTTSAAAGDMIAIWRTANGDSRRITKANLMGGVLTGGGTFASGGFTGTLTATGTLGLLGTAQTYSALKTFSAGINLGQTSNFSYYNTDVWTPGISFGGGTTGITYGVQYGLYTRIGQMCTVFCHILLSAKGSSTGAALVTGLPFTSTSASSNYRSIGALYDNAMTMTGKGIVSISNASTTVSLLLSNAGTVSSLTDSNFQNATRIMFTLAYTI